MPAFDLDKPHGPVADRPAPAGAHTDSDEIEELFDTAFQSVGFPHEFLENLYSWWEEKGFLTEKQYAALCKFAGEDQ